MVQVVMRIDIDVRNIDKNDKNIWRSIYKPICVPYFVGVKLFPKSFLGNFKNHMNDPQNITT